MEDFYPSVKAKLVKAAIRDFAKDLPEEDKKIIEECIEMIQFGMKSTFVRYKDQYYEYDIATDPENKGLSIGGYPSAWLADLAGA